MLDKITVVMYDPEVKKILEKSSKPLALACLSMLLFILVLIYSLIVTIKFNKNVRFDATLLSNPILENPILSKAGYVIYNKRYLDSCLIKKVLFGDKGKLTAAVDRYLHKNKINDGEKDLFIYIPTNTSLIQPIPAFYKVSFNSYPLIQLHNINAQVIASKISKDRTTLELLLRVPAAKLKLVKDYYYYNYSTSIDLTIGKQSFFDYIIHPYK